MESDLQKKRKSAEDSALSDDVTAEKIKFPLYVFPDTMEKVDMLYEIDNCRSKTEFMEKAIRFYCGYLLNKESTATEFIAPQLAVITEGIVKGSEQKLSRALFKLAVEVGALTHMVAAINEIDDDTLQKLRIMCVDEVKRINGIINFEKAVLQKQNLNGRIIRNILPLVSRLKFVSRVKNILRRIRKSCCMNCLMIFRKQKNIWNLRITKLILQLKMRLN